MAHNLYMKANGQAAMAYTGADPWHRLGTAADGETDIVKWMSMAALNVTVSKVAFLMPDGTPVYKLTDDKCYMTQFSDGEYGGVVGADYSTDGIQPMDVFPAFQAAVNRKRLRPATAGRLNGGVMWMLFEVVGAGASIVKGDDVHMYVLVAVGYNGKLRLFFGPNTHRPVCQNTLYPALAENTMMAIKHTKSAGATFAAAMEALDALIENWQLGIEVFRALAKAKVQDETTLRAYYRAVQGTEENREKARKSSARAKIDAMIANAATGDGIIAQQLKSELGAANVFEALMAKPLVTSGETARYSAAENEFVTFFHGEAPGCGVGETAGTWEDAYQAKNYQLNYSQGRSDQSRFETVMFGANNGMARRALSEAVKYAGLADRFPKL